MAGIANAPSGIDPNDGGLQQIGFPPPGDELAQIPTSSPKPTPIGNTVSTAITDALRGVGNALSAPMDTPGFSDPHSNEPMSFELYSNKLPYATGLVHGYMRTAPPTSFGSDPSLSPGGPFYVFFLFNPQQIQINYGLTDSLIPSIFYQNPDPNNPSGQPGTDQLAQAAALQNQAVTFTIQFDRTYEVDTFMRTVGNSTIQPPISPAGGIGGNAGPGRDGVMWDIRALERLMGMFDLKNTPSQGAAGSRATTSIPPGTGNSGSNTPPMTGPIDVYFGSQHAYTFRGYFSSFAVELQRFNKYMVPTHCSCDITMLLVYRDARETDISTTQASTINALGQVQNAVAGNEGPTAKQGQGFVGGSIPGPNPGAAR